MRKLLFYGFVGFASLACLPGCGSVQNLREARTEERRCSKCALCRVTRPPDGGHVQIAVSDWSESAGPPTALPSISIKEKPPVLSEQLTESGPRLSEPSAALNPIPSLIEPQIDKGISEQMADTSRDDAPLANKGTTTAQGELPSHPLQRGAEPRIPSENPVKAANESKVPNTEIVAQSGLENETRGPITSLRIQLGQTENFKFVTGQVMLFRQTLRLRYAAIDQEDLYGGSVILEGGAELSKVREGQHIRVRGELIPPADRAGSARFRVTAVEILD